MNFSKLDEDTKHLFGEIFCCLNNLFGYSETETKELIDNYLAQYYSQDEEDLLHHEGSYRAAGIIHFTAGLKMSRSELRQYLSEGLPVKSVEAVSLLADYRRNNQLPKILGGNV